MKKTLMVAVCFFAAVVCWGAEKVEREVTCSQCRGSGVKTKWVKCPVCDGKAEIVSKIHNGSMHNTNFARAEKPTKKNRKRCENCLKSAKKGKVKEEFPCPKCNGTGKMTIKVLDYGAR